LTGAVARTEAGVGSLVGEVGTGRVSRIETNVAQLVHEIGTGLVQQAANAGGAQTTDLAPVESSLAQVSRNVSDLQAAFAAVDLTAIDRLEARIGRLGDSSGNTFFGRLATLERLLQAVGGTAGDAARKAQQAKNEASNAATGLGELRQLIARNDVQGAMAQLSDIKQSLMRLQGSVGELPKSVQYTAIQTDIVRVAKTIDQLASSQGYPKLLAGEFGLAGFDPASFGKFMAESGGNITSLMSVVAEMKGTMDFLSKFVQEQQDKPVVTTTFVGEAE
jgi:hypothetical protein